MSMEEITEAAGSRCLTGRSGLAGVDVSNDDDVDVGLLFLTVEGELLAIDSEEHPSTMDFDGKQRFLTPWWRC